MNDLNKTKEQLANELMTLRKQVDDLENDKIERRKKERILLLTQFTVDRAADAIFWMSPDAKFSFVNDEACRSLGYSRKELLSMTVHEIDPNFPAEVWPDHWEDVKHRGSFTFESRHRTKDGMVFPVEITVNYLNFDGEEYNCAFARNITKRKDIEERIKRSEEIYRSFVQNFQGIAYKGNMDFTAIFFHGLVEKITGYTEEEFINGRPRWDKIIHPDDLPELKDSFESIRLVPNYSDVREYRIICKNGQTRWVRERIKNICDNSGKPVVVQGIIQDITAEKSAEIDLRDSEKKYHRLIDALQEGIWMIDNGDKTTFANERLTDMLGYTAEEMLGKSVFSFMDDHWIEVCKYYVERRRNGIREQHDFELIKKDGSPLNVTMAASPVYDENGNYTGGIAGVIDITERKLAEEELKKFKFISDNANDAHFLVDRDAKFQYVNETAAKMLGYSKEELLTLGVPDVDIVYGIEKFRELFELIQVGEVPPIQSVNRRKDETVFCSEISVTGYKIEGAPYMFAVLRDITKRKKAEEKLRASLEEKEVLMREVHHRVKNNMAVVSSLLRLQSAKVEDEHYKAMFNDSVSRIKAMGSIHNKLYQSEEVSKILLSDYIKDMVNNIFRSYELGSRIKLITDIEEITLGIDASIPCGLIVNELITNTMKYAFPEEREGEIKVSLHKNDKDEIELTFGDNGVGMPEGLDFRNQDSLGLTIVNSLVEQLQGEIELIKEKGTQFKITFRKT